MTKPDKDPRGALDEIAIAIEKLTVSLEARETEGGRLTAPEIDAFARRLQIHVEELLAASKNLSGQKLDG